MNARTVNNTLGRYVTIDQICEICNLGRATVRRLAEESGSTRRIGRCTRINREKFLEYIEKEYA